MAAYKFFNIGKANAEIDRLTAELAAKPASADASHLADALASNETISTQLTQANADLVTAKASIASTNTALEKAQGEVNTIGGALKAACVAMKLNIKEGATSAEMIAAMQGGVSTTLAALQVPAAAIPAPAPAGTQASANKPELKGRARMLAAMKIEGIHFNTTQN